MPTRRRTLLAVAASTLAAGCLNTGPGGTDDGERTDTTIQETTTTAAPTTTQDATTTRGGETPSCDPADVTRPAVASGGNIEGREYPTKPDSLTENSILLYLDDFETAYAWNRVLETEDVTSLNIEVLEGFQPDETGDGYLASSAMRVTFTVEDGETTEREYRANYFVSPGPVYRYESESDPVAPREQEDTELVQCGTGN